MAAIEIKTAVFDCSHCVLRVAPMAALVLVVVLIRAAPTSAHVDEDTAVSAGAEALNSWWNYPWYDSETDNIRRINLKVKSPQAAPVQTTSTGSWDLEWLGWLLIIALAIALVIILLRVYWNRGARAGGSGRPSLVGAPASVDRLEELPFQLEAPSDDLLSAARRAAERGNYDQAIVFLYSHQLLELDKRDAIRLTKGKTNRQYLRELRTRPGMMHLLATSMVAFEDVFFGGHSLGRDRFEDCWDQAMQLLAAPEAREAA